MNKAVIGLGFGDEGKGRVVDWLSSSSDANTLIVRYSGGHQAAHNVILPDVNTQHVFASFGSGTLRNKPTYTSKYCTVEPIGLMNEFVALINKGFNPLLYIDGKCPITTPYDRTSNIMLDGVTKHGTCGVGFGETWKREENHYSLLFEDLFNPSILKIKLDMISKFYGFTCEKWYIHHFTECCNLLCEYVKLSYGIPSGYKDIIFEGSQGLLLDQDYGFFPHVTRSSVGTKNIMKLSDCYVNGLKVYLVTRAYQTRHGNGPMTNENIPHNIKENPYEQNGDDGSQGYFRIALLDLDLLEYSINKDHYIKQTKDITLVITCMDLIENEYRFTYRGNIVYNSNKSEFVRSIKSILKIDKVLLSDKPYGYLKEFV